VVLRGVPPGFFNVPPLLQIRVEMYGLGFRYHFYYPTPASSCSAEELRLNRESSTPTTNSSVFANSPVLLQKYILLQYIFFFSQIRLQSSAEVHVLLVHILRQSSSAICTPPLQNIPGRLPTCCLPTTHERAHELTYSWSASRSQPSPPFLGNA
jgi:hypothetical protein